MNDQLYKDISTVFTSPEQLRAASNFVHVAWGVYMGIIGILLLIGLRTKKERLIQVLVACLLSLFGLIYLGYWFFSHGISNFPIILRLTLSEQTQILHVLMGFLYLLAGLIELIRLKFNLKDKAFSLILPIIFFIFAYIISIHHAFHRDHSTAVFHTFLSVGVYITAFFLFLSRLSDSEKESRFFLYLTICAIFVVFLLLVNYREPANAMNEYFLNNPYLKP